MAEEERRVEVFAEIACPFTHACLETFVAERSRRGASTRLVLRAWPLEVVNGKPLDPTAVAEEIAALRAQVTPSLFRAQDATLVPASSMRAFGLVTAAYRDGDEVGEAIGLGVRRALFEAGRDVGDDSVLREIGAPFGVQPLSPEEATAIVDADWNAGGARDVQGSPHFFFGDHSWFSPSLAITKTRRTITVRPDEATLAEFYAVVFADTPSR